MVWAALRQTRRCKTISFLSRPALVELCTREEHKSCNSRPSGPFPNARSFLTGRKSPSFHPMGVTADNAHATHACKHYFPLGCCTSIWPQLQLYSPAFRNRINALMSKVNNIYRKGESFNVVYWLHFALGDSLVSVFQCTRTNSFLPRPEAQKTGDSDREETYKEATTIQPLVFSFFLSFRYIH